MAVSKKQSTKTATKSSVPEAVNDSVPLFKLENNIPIPERGNRDPEFVAKVTNLLSIIKTSQSFVVPKKKAHHVKKLSQNENFVHMHIRMSTIKPDEKFVRIWRVK